jgi:DNA-binding ferritin-like protein
MDEVQVIQYMLGLLSQIKLFHWSTTRYVIHKALDELHEHTAKQVDLFVESYLGRYNKQPLKKFTIQTKATAEAELVHDWLVSQRDTLDRMQKTFAKASDLQNILQTMIADFNSTIYLCKLM